MIARRALLSAGATMALSPLLARASDMQLSFSGSMEQGGLVVGKAEAGTRISIDGVSVLVSPGGMFALGISYDRANPIYLVAQYVDGTREVRDLAPVVRQYETQAITGLPHKFVEPTPEELERIKREAGLIWEARKRETDGIGFAEPLDWPIPGIVSSVYGSRRILNGIPSAPHLGIDIAAPEGTPIHAPADGVVTISDEYFLDGGFTLIDHGHGVSTCYLHQSKRMTVAGDKVSRGDIIGLVGQTGRATGPHVHWGLCWFQVKLDPSRSTRTPEPARA